ncbi:MAG: hypothetical protein IT444_12700 [Phycisphaeraceae bacterium]|nr:hypothetical protein [Phycisphaeraceae bacterium]
MNKRSLGALIALNIVLVVALALVSFLPQPAAAQAFGRAQYIMVAGSAVGRELESVIYIIELNTGRVAAIIFRGSDNTFEPIAGRNIMEDLNSGKR